LAAIRLQNITKVYSVRDVSNHARRLTSGAERARQKQAFVPNTLAPSVPPAPIKALDNLNLTIPDGQAIAIVGPSGCGKSTLLRAIAGLVDYTGDIFYDEQNMNTVPVKERYIGMVFQNYALYPHFYGHGNLSFFFKIHKAPNAETEERIRITSEIMGIGFEDLLKRKPGTLSGGQQQRVAIARAIVRKPRLFLLDEPLSNLDAKLRTQTRVEIKRLLNRFNITTVYVTHDQIEATSIGDRIAVMRAGRVVQVASYQELQRNPVNAFVAGFLGLPPMNLLQGTVADGALKLDSIHVPLPPGIAAQTHIGQTVTLGFRPDAAVAGPEAHTHPQSLHLHGTIDVVEPDFGRRRQQAYVRTDTITYRVMASLELDLIQGYPIDVAIPTAALYFFDAKSEMRLKEV